MQSLECEIGRREGICEARLGSERECRGEGAGGGLSFAINIVSLDSGNKKQEQS